MNTFFFAFSLVPIKILSKMWILHIQITYTCTNYEILNNKMTLNVYVFLTQSTLLMFILIHNFFPGLPVYYMNYKKLLMTFREIL